MQKKFNNTQIMIHIPPKERKEWRDLLTGQINVPLKNFFFQMKITQAKKQVKKAKVTVDDAVDEIYELCVKFSKAKYMDVDIQNIFGSEVSEKVAHIEEEKLVEQPVKEEETPDANAQEKIEKINKLRLKEEEAKRQRELVNQRKTEQVEQPVKAAQSVKLDKVEQIRLEAQRVIQQRYEMELAKRKKEIKPKQVSEPKSEITQSPEVRKDVQNFKRMEEEKQRVKQLKKKKVVRKKKSGFGSFFKSWFN